MVLAHLSLRIGLLSWAIAFTEFADRP